MTLIGSQHDSRVLIYDCSTHSSTYILVKPRYTTPILGLGTGVVEKIRERSGSPVGRMNGRDVSRKIFIQMQMRR